MTPIGALLSLLPGYPQTWHLVTRIEIGFLRRGIQRVCGAITGHELSLTEWSYGGGGVAERNCRWCDQAFEVPTSEVRRDFPESADMIDAFDRKRSIQ